MKSDEIIEKIRRKLQESNPEQRTVLNVFQFNFTDANGQIIKRIVFDFKALNIYEGSTEAKDAEVTIADEDFYGVGCKQCTFDDLLDAKKVQVQGDKIAFNNMLNKFRMN